MKKFVPSWFPSWFRKTLAACPPGPDLALIEYFSSSEDRSYPPVFVGRKQELGIVDRNCRFALAKHRQGDRTGGHLLLFRGAPGAGKSSLLEHLEKTWRQANDPAVIYAPRNMLLDSAELVRHIGERVMPKKVRKLARITRSSVRAGIRPEGTGIEGSATRETQAGRIRFEKLAKLNPKKRWDRPVCLLIDEIQDVGENHEDCLNELHLGEHGLPIVTICAGLGNSAEMMQRAISPRLADDNLLTLGALLPDEVQSCVKRMFDRCRVVYSPGEWEPIAAGIAKRSEDWPQHVRTETAALFGGLLESRGILGKVNLAAVRQQAVDKRKANYSLRQSGAMGERPSLAPNILKAIPESGISRDSALRLIAEQAKPPGPGIPALPSGMDADKFLNHLIRQGIFQPEPGGMLSLPIPSLRQWLIDSIEVPQKKADEKA